MQGGRKERANKLKNTNNPTTHKETTNERPNDIKKTEIKKEITTHRNTEQTQRTTSGPIERHN